MSIRIVAVGLAVLALLASACSSSPAATSTPAGSMSGSSGMSGDGGFAFGEPGDAGSVDRTVQITQLDSMRFDPSAISVKVGETVKFEVTDAGSLPHEFVLGDEALQSEHEGQMGGMGGSMMADDPNSISLEPGMTKSVVWTFTQPGDALFGCHVPGHYEAGMVGTITVTA